MFMISNILVAIGNFVANISQAGCVLFFVLDEPDCPKSLIQ